MSLNYEYYEINLSYHYFQLFNVSIFLSNLIYVIIKIIINLNLFIILLHLIITILYQPNLYINLSYFLVLFPHLFSSLIIHLIVIVLIINF